MRRGLGAWLLATVLAGPAQAGGRPSVEIHPAGPTVPENLLRIELRFARPLRLPLALSQVALLDAQGQAIDGAFLDLVLPSADGRRITLLLHPARVKSGVAANLALGRALQAGAYVTLQVRLADKAAASRRWLVTPADTASPDPARWRIDPPRAGSRQALVVRLDDVLSSSAQDFIAVRSPAGTAVAGHSELVDGDTTWRFVPRAPWTAGGYAVVTHPQLEDPSGNRVCAPFEAVDEHAIACRDGVSLAFEPRPAGINALLRPGPSAPVRQAAGPVARPGRAP